MALGENARVPWKARFPSVPAHPAQRYDFRVAEDAEDGGRTVGHLLVFAESYARQAGHVWWKTLSDPCPALEVWSFIDGEWDELFLLDIDEVVATIEGLERSQWQWFASDVATTVLLRWLDVDESARVAADVFGVDLEVERRRRMRGD